MRWTARKGEGGWRSSLPARALHTYAEASIYNVPLARVVSKKSITQQHTRESCTRYLRMVHPTLVRSPLLSHYGGSAEHSRPLQASIFSGVPPPFPPVRLTYLFYTARTLHDRTGALGMEFFIKPLFRRGFLRPSLQPRARARFETTRRHSTTFIFAKSMHPMVLLNMIYSLRWVTTDTDNVTDDKDIHILRKH